MSTRQRSPAAARRLHLGPQQPAGRPCASRVSWELLFPGGPNCGLRLRSEYRTRSAELLRKTVRSFAPTGLTLRVGPECCEARPVRPRRCGLPGLVVGREPQGEWVGRPFRRRRRGRREREAPAPLRAALAASLQPGLGRGCGSRARPAAPPPPPPARLSGRSSRPVGLVADGAGAGTRRAHGWPRGAAAGGCSDRGSTRPAARTRRRRAGRAEPGARPETERKRK